MKRARLVALAASCIALAACYSHERPARDATSDATRMRNAPEMEDAKRAAPQLFAQGDEEIARSREATAQGDDTSAALHAENAEALFYRARVNARLARADEERLDAERARDAAISQRDGWAKTRAELARASADLDVRLRIAREKAFPAASGPASKERIEARRVAARSLVEEAHLLCVAAQIVGSGAPSPGATSTSESDEVDAIDQALADPAASAKDDKGALFDRAARVRVRCLSALEHARKDDAQVDTKNDALLASLSSAGFHPTRAEQGIVVTLAQPFEGARLAEDANKRLIELGRVAKQEGVGVELIVHDATESKAILDAEKSRGDVASDSLAKGGIDRASVHVVLAGASLPLFDPQDAARRSKNARLDVIFVR